MTDLTVNDIELYIDDELSGFLRVHTKEESSELRDSVEQVGRFVEPLAYWSEKDLLVDGHRRMELWNSLPEDTEIPPPKVIGISFPDKESVIKWMLRKQLGRRNLSSHDFTLTLGRLYNQEKKPTGRPKEPEPENGKPKRKSKTAKPQSTANRIAEESGVSPRTVRSAGKYAQAVDVLGGVSQKFKTDIESGGIKASQQDVIKIATLDKKSIPKAIRNLKMGRRWDHEIDGGEEPKKEKPEHLKRLEAALRTHADTSSHLYGACNASDRVKKSHFEKMLVDLHAAIETVKQKEAREWAKN